VSSSFARVRGTKYRKYRSFETGFESASAIKGLSSAPGLSKDSPFQIAHLAMSDPFAICGLDNKSIIEAISENVRDPRSLLLRSESIFSLSAK